MISYVALLSFDNATCSLRFNLYNRDYFYTILEFLLRIKMLSFSELVSRYMSSSSIKRSNPPPKLALSTAANNSSGTGTMDGQDDGTVLTTPDIQGTVTTPGMIEMLGRNGNTFNQFSLAPITSSTMGQTTQSIPTMTNRCVILFTYVFFVHTNYFYPSKRLH